MFPSEQSIVCILAGVIEQPLGDDKKAPAYLLIVAQQRLNGQDAFDHYGLNLVPEPCEAEALLLHPGSAFQASHQY